MKDLQKELDSLLELSEKSINKRDFRNFDSVDLLCYFSKNELGLKYWKPLFVLVLLRWGFNTKSAKKLFEFGEYGHNWEKLHETEEEKKKTLEEKLKDFYGYIGYCSDRMGFDRLFRIHFIYNLIQRYHFKKDD